MGSIAPPAHIIVQFSVHLRITDLFGRLLQLVGQRSRYSRVKAQRPGNRLGRQQPESLRVSRVIVKRRDRLQVL